MTELNADLDLYLASASPRRADLLRQIGLRFEVISDLDVDESPLNSESPEEYVQRLAHDKAIAGYSRLSFVAGHGQPAAVPPVLGADTCIVVDDEILGKPKGRDEGIAMLQRLSGRSHEVLTAICLADGRSEKQSLSRTSVTLKALKADEIVCYWESGEPVDKAGAYAIQGLAARFVTYLQGSYSGVVGLPLYELSELLLCDH